MRGNGLSRARSILLTILSIEVAVLVVTGIALLFVYVPTQRQAWSDLITKSHGVSAADGIRFAHWLASVLAFPTAIATGIVLALRSGATVRRWTGITLGVGLPLAAAFAGFTGYLLPWDQLALWSVRPGANFRGYTFLFDSSVRFILLGGSEVTKDTLIAWLVVHVLVVGRAVVGLVALGWRRHVSLRRVR